MPKGVVDIVFLIDATGSMSPCIDALKANIQTFVETLTTKDPNNSLIVNDWRAKVVGYRDWKHDSIPFIDHPFVASVDELRSQLNSLRADGGGDEPESLLEAIYKIATMGATGKDELANPAHWRHRTAAARVVIIFTDASFNEPLHEPKNATLDDIQNLLMENRIILSIFAPKMECYERLSEVDKSEWNIVEGGKSPQEALALFTTDQNNFAETMRQLAKTISKTADVPLLV